MSDPPPRRPHTNSSSPASVQTGLLKESSSSLRHKFVPSLGASCLVDGGHNQVGCCLVNHMAASRNSMERTLLYIAVKPVGLLADVDETVFFASDDDHRHTEFRIVCLKDERVRNHKR